MARPVHRVMNGVGDSLTHGLKDSAELYVLRPGEKERREGSSVRADQSDGMLPVPIPLRLETSPSGEQRRRRVRRSEPKLGMSEPGSR